MRPRSIVSRMGVVRVGTCSWADEALSKHFYPRGTTPRERLTYYADRFSTVEVDSTYYRLPDEKLVRGWDERTPDGFVMHIKAFGLMTRHPVKAEVLPPEIREQVEVDARGRVDRPPREVRAEVFRLFRESLEPLREAGKLGGVLMQFPSYVVPKDASVAYLEWAREQLPDDELLVEFRHREWLDDAHRPDTLALLESLGAAHVVTDSPPTGGRNVVPTVIAATSPRTAYLRLHGRNADTWNRRGGGAAERFDYLYSEQELKEWVEPLRELSEQAEVAYAFFNNNNRSPGPPGGPEWVSQAATNAEQLKGLLDVNGIRVG
jgi:uncharacterized protein YecE (DUF72 family)